MSGVLQILGGEPWYARELILADFCYISYNSLVIVFKSGLFGERSRIFVIISPSFYQFNNCYRSSNIGSDSRHIKFRFKKARECCQKITTTVKTQIFREVSVGSQEQQRHFDDDGVDDINTTTNEEPKNNFSFNFIQFLIVVYERRSLCRYKLRTFHVIL